MCAAQATPLRTSHPLPTPAERLASPPLRGSCSRPLFPDSLQLLNLYLILHKFHLSAAVAAASTSMGCILVRTAWRRGGVRLYMRAIREHPAPPDPPYRILRPLRSRQRKHARGAALPPFGRPHQCGGWPRFSPLLAAAERERLKKRAKNRLHYVTASQ